MNKVVKDVIKNALIMFAVGMLLAVAAPVLANVVGGAAVLGPEAFAHAVTTPVIWTGIFFSGFGAIHAAVAPAMDYVFGKEAKEEANSPKVLVVRARSAEVTPQAVTITNNQLQPNIAVDATLAADSKTANLYTQLIEKQAGEPAQAIMRT